MVIVHFSDEEVHLVVCVVCAGIEYLPILNNVLGPFFKVFLCLRVQEYNIIYVFCGPLMVDQ